MSYREVAIAVEAEASVGRWTAILEGTYRKFDEQITTRSQRPWSVAWYIFECGSDRYVRNLAALWLYRHDDRRGVEHDDYDEPVVNPEIANMLDQALEEARNGRTNRK